MEVLANGRVLIDEGFVANRVVLIDGERIVAVTGADDSRCASARRHDLKGAMLLPGFVDSQVNGGGGVLFNDDPSVEAIRTIGAAHRRFGTTAFLPTLISEDFAVIARAIRAVRSAIEAGTPGASPRSRRATIRAWPLPSAATSAAPGSCRASSTAR